MDGGHGTTVLLTPPRPVTTARQDIHWHVDEQVATTFKPTVIPRPYRQDTDSLGVLVGWSAAAAWLLLVGIETWTGSVLVAWILPISLVAELTALGALVLIWSRRAVPQWLQVTLLVCAALTILSRCYLLVLGKPSYGTDEIAFDQYAAQLLLFHGLNPYTHTMAPALNMFQVPDIYHTYTLSGQEVSRVSYPAGSFLAYVPALWAGLRMQAAVVVDVLAWVVTMFLGWRLLPSQVRWVVIPIATEFLYLGYIAGGVSDSIYLPFLIVAYWRWDRFGDPTEKSVARWIGPIMIGLAATVKQTPWFAVPFLVVGVAIEAHQRGQSWFRMAARYLALALAAFAVVNLPFLVMNPTAWVRGVLTPLEAHLIPSGQGLVGLTMFEHLGGQLRFYTYASVLVVVVALGVYLGWYKTAKRVWPALLPLAFFWPNRSFASYMLMMVPAILVGTTTVRETTAQGWRMARLVFAGGLAATAACLVAALTLKPSLSLQVVGERSTGQLESIDHLAVRVTNHSGSPVTPHFTITPAGQQTSFWYSNHSPLTIRPHATAVENLEAPNTESMPGMNGGFIVDAFSDNPAQIATSSTIRPPTESAFLTPQGVDRPVRLGTSTELTVQLVNQIGGSRATKGVTVALGQIVYSQDGLLPGEASIDGQAEAQTPVLRQTDRTGKVVFTVSGVQAQQDPVFFQAWLVPSSGVPTGYSNIVSMQFSG
ncbi:MAG TPA: hypothetical protein VII76_02300 [Acidimicrobiales bacterium]